MVDALITLWPTLAGVFGIVGAIAVTIHAVLGRRDTGTVIGWIGLAWLVPVFGPIIYYAFGINRIRRRAVALKVRGRKVSTEPRVEFEDLRLHRELTEESPNIEGLMRLGSRLMGRPLLPGNAVEPLVNGDEAYPAMLEAIAGAERSVDLLTYIFDCDRAGDHFLEALGEARSRGVEVRVLIDHVGSRYSSPPMVHRLREAGLRVETFLPTWTPKSFPYTNLRNHRKILVVDGRTGFTGGTNIREGHVLGLRPEAPVRCLHFKAEGPLVVDLQRVFAVDWAFATGEVLDGDAWFPELERAGSLAGRGISDGPDEDLDHMVEVILGALAIASRQVRIVTPYFLPDTAILRALSVTTLRGVDVEIVIPERCNIPVVSWATTAILGPLIEKGCRVYYTGEPFDHSKIMLVDGVWSLIGSTNWDIRSLRLNFEFNLECYGGSLASRLSALVDEKLQDAREVTLDEVERRPLPIKLRDGIARLGTPYL